MEYKYNYVVFNSLDGPIWKDNPDGYYNICVEELKKVEGIDVVTAPVGHLNKTIRYLFYLHNSRSFKKVPLKRLWYPYYFKNRFKNSKPLCIILINKKLPLSYLPYLKKRYPDCKIVVLFRDLIKVSQRLNSGIHSNPNVDIYMTFDNGESKKYSMPYFNEFESLLNIPKLEIAESDVYFAGKGKDRLPILLEIYRQLSSYGLKVKYYLTGVPVNEQVLLEGVEYADHFMSYKEMLYHTINTRYVLEINQGGADGYTSRFLEAVMYNKKLITNNSYIKQSKFYNPQYIHIINSAEDIQKSFFEYNGDVDYHYNGEFSPLRMIERVEEELIKKYGEPGR